MFVKYGIHNISNEENEGMIAEIESFIMHEDFASDYIHDTDDIALIKLKEPVSFGPNVLPVCLPQKGIDYSKKRATVVGWGKKSQEDLFSEVLLKINVTTLTNEDCKKVKVLSSHLSDSMLCAYGDNVDACQGDSGGPLLYKANEDKEEIIGVVSWGVGCAQPGIPGVYSRVADYLEWIALHTTDSKYCYNSF
ncbi:tripsin, putative [Pediculus humanus corporis]|uniref:Tripsin, putative n=1 Tax=Pediculus humanus subsp. corporis TaxID=121224 RepID=E0VW16_PEDHC|nr:tripsin, putative [Pediculus humanus corporis]EEB17572.1 tripsin, putative [Pediculus humanus corporis]